MADVPVLDDPFAILSEAEQAPTPVRVLKDQDAFAVFDLHGDIVPGPGRQYGMYHAGTRFLSGFELLLAGRQPLLLSSTISDDNVVFSADLTNPDVIRDARVVLPRGTLHLFRARVLQGDRACRTAQGDQSRPRAAGGAPHDPARSRLRGRVRGARHAASGARRIASRR